MSQNIQPALMFEGQGSDAMAFYLSLFPGAETLRDVRYGPQGPGKEGTVMQAMIKLNGLEIRISDSPIHHAFGMTPATSLFITCDDEAEFDRLFAALSEGGEVRMPVNNYGFSRKFGWTDDRFGVSWQLNLM